MVKMRVKTPSVNYQLFHESSKHLAKQKGKVSKVSEVESKAVEEVSKERKAMQAKKVNEECKTEEKSAHSKARM